MAILNISATNIIDMMDAQKVGHLYPGKAPNTMTLIYETMARFPDNTIVLAHWGGGIFFYNLLKKLLKGP